MMNFVQSFNGVKHTKKKVCVLISTNGVEVREESKKRDKICDYPLASLADWR